MSNKNATVDSESKARLQSGCGLGDGSLTERGSVEAFTAERREVDRRQNRVSLVWPERRSGFDRRGPAPNANRASVAFEGILTGLRDRPAAVRVMLVAINMLNLADFVLTINVLSTGGGEANPIMRSLFALNPVYAGVFKIIAIVLISLVLWRFRRYRSALEIALVVLAVFMGVFFYHVLGMLAFR
jgi:hypothetical protein